jgi:hypothetical protein
MKGGPRLTVKLSGAGQKGGGDGPLRASSRQPTAPLTGREVDARSSSTVMLARKGGSSTDAFTAVTFSRDSITAILRMSNTYEIGIVLAKYIIHSVLLVGLKLLLIG